MATSLPVAFVAAAEGAPPEDPTGELRAYLQRRLPAHLVPSLFFALPALPLTPNGKVDRKALRTAHLPAKQRKGEFVAPRNAVEEILAQIWQELLGVERVGAYDNFFDLGGHSLQGIRS